MQEEIDMQEEIETQYTPMPLTDNLYFEPNIPKFKKQSDGRWIKKITPIINQSANVSCGLYPFNQYRVDCPIFI